MILTLFFNVETLNCSDACHTMDTIRALDLFEEGCRITTKGVWPNLTKMSQRYQPKKAVHIFRSPFDNLIARKHLGAKRRISLGIFNKNHTAFRDDRAGMLAWCDFIDQGFGTSVHNKGIKPFTDETTRLMKKVPCYSGKSVHVLLPLKVAPDYTPFVI
jgi:hypothetical protein